ncbi:MULTISPECIES: PEP-CTERM sorting domain-containing protein [unclassified Lentimonas]|uniref:PEP-CTERM sorting domain-containing protein n=1 Tax=unclassified Lentimonas TaxID=2630993 RepID=UPI001323E302|nr:MULTISPECIES: PEP-CTERM sorting domain-containing protein [unclassified Lentimonas]CAA6679663.1 Unannotated [Lentimonas sp. CC4]CAA6683570.1 Unannotated [Lentimonas sp. CC6]CAA7077332.1 Unannotated [Lentimonas sp. CC4]CAA7170153.1 Unannotated [Lentimonas sp. CC21]CAA7182460.1 Unannotated [Lentimonas sp. CC8]
MKKILSLFTLTAAVAVTAQATTVDFTTGYSDGNLTDHADWLSQNDNLVVDSATTGAVNLDADSNWSAAMFNEQYSAADAFSIDIDFSFTQTAAANNKDVVSLMFSSEFATGSQLRFGLRRKTDGDYGFFIPGVTNISVLDVATAVQLGFDDAATGDSDQLNIKVDILRNTTDAVANSWDYSITLSNTDLATMYTASGTTVSALLLDDATGLYGGFSSSVTDTVGLVSNRQIQAFSVNGTAIPEPGAFALIAGALALGFVTVRRRK